MANKPGKVVTYSNELPSIKSRPFYRVVYLVILMSLIQFAGLERKRLKSLSNCCCTHYQPHIY